MIPNEVMLAILQKQIKNAIDENKVDTSKFAVGKTIDKASSLTIEEKTSISENAYTFLIENETNDIYVLSHHLSSDDWGYYNLDSNHLFLLYPNEFKRIDLAEFYLVTASINGDVDYTDVKGDPSDFPSSNDLVLEAKKYPGVTFYSNYYTDEPTPIYRFSSGIILDSSTETPLYKIVFASYNVNTAKVTFVEKVLT